MAAKNRRMFELRLGKLGLILFIGGMSLLLFSMFFLGIIIGQHMETYPESFSPGVAGLIRDRLFDPAPQPDEATPSAEAKKRDAPVGGEKRFGLTFYETLDGKKGGTQTATTADTVKDQPPETSVPVFVPTGKPALSEPSTGSAGGAVGNTESQVPGSEGDGKKTNLTPGKKAAMESGAKVSAAMPVGTAVDGRAIPEKGHFQIQVAAYQESGKAEQMMKKLSSLGFASRVATKELPGKGKWFRVIVVGFENREKAKVAADRITEKIRGVKCVILSSAKNGGN